MGIGKKRALELQKQIDEIKLDYKRLWEIVMLIRDGALDTHNRMKETTYVTNAIFDMLERIGLITMTKDMKVDVTEAFKEENNLWWKSFVEKRGYL